MLYDVAIFIAGILSGLGIGKYMKLFTIIVPSESPKIEAEVETPNETIIKHLRNCIIHMDGFKNKSEVKIRRESQLLVDSLKSEYKWPQS